MDKPTLYMETTIPSYLLAELSCDVVAAGRQEITRLWWKRDHTRFSVFISDAVLKEAEKGDRWAARKRLVFLDQFPVLGVTPDIQPTIELYLRVPCSRLTVFR